MTKKLEDRMELEQELKDGSEPALPPFLAFGKFMDDVGQLIMEMEIQMRDYRDEIERQDRRIEQRDRRIEQLETSLAETKATRDSGNQRLKAV